MMTKNSSISIGDHFKGFINQQIDNARYDSTSEVVRAGLQPHEEHDRKIVRLRQALIDGENSGEADELDMKKIKAEARVLSSR